MRRAIGALLAAIALATLPAGADHLEHQICPAEPTRDFPAAFEAPVDRQAVVCSGTANPWTDLHVGGWGGGDCPADHVPRIPVVFVHGNGVDGYYFNASYDAADGSHVNVRQRFLDAGYCARELWAITYSGEATPARGQAASFNTYADINADETLEFLQAVRDFTGAPRVDVIAHSLGVTVVRKAMFLHRAHPQSPFELVRRVIAIAGANHGTTTCRGEEDAAALHVCEETHPGSPWLDELNAIGEAPGPTEWMTVCDCTGLADEFYLLMDAESPLLEGAKELRLPLVSHLPLASSEQAIAAYMPFVIEGSVAAAAAVTQAEAPRSRPSQAKAKPAEVRAGPTLPATGVARVTLSWIASLFAFASAVALIRVSIR